MAEDGVPAPVVGELAHETVQRTGQVHWLGAQHDPSFAILMDDLVTSQSG
ncbi:MULTISPECIES: hypothetical protein [Pseudonocardiaceae]|uniref:Uncharacterized protein n=1 Tax=Amycolatopsis roodepoortensis TaxID=700274 RepID=A0ABR9LFL5_9PSEU|nr:MULTISPECIES: hypothetical protein [Pseudonocardiaceae]MBE1579454.1 hypothetical protein [Amycolatopsis roodepoortensis]